GAARGGGEIGERHRIKVIVGEDDESKSLAAQRDDLADDVGYATLSRFLSVGSPHRAERAMLGTAADGLDRPPHVSPVRQEVPSCRRKLLAADAPALVREFRR